MNERSTQLPRKITVIYDGSCNLCAGNLHWLHRLDWWHRMEALPFQSDEVFERFPKLTRAECEKAMQVVLEDGRVESGAAAIREVFLCMPATWVVGIVMSIPPFACILDRLYRKWAPYRYAFAGRCPVDLNIKKSLR